MNEETPNTVQPEKTGLDETRKTALLRYIAILFAVAFLMVLLSLFSQMRSSRAEISQLNQSSTSAVAKAQQLQQTNEALREENEALTEEIARLEEALAQAEHEIATQNSTAKNNQATLAYEILLEAMSQVTPGSQEGNISVARALENLKNLKQYLGEHGLEAYENLLEEGE